jgi:AraC-like DNA-binding protein
MPQKRQMDSIVIRTHLMRHSAPNSIPTHTHTWSQLIYAHSGVITVHTGAGSWVVPPGRGVWVPAGMTHSIEMSGEVSMRSLYFAPRFARKRLPKSCSVVDISPLMRELILHVATNAALDRSIPEHAHLIAVILDQLATLAEVPLQLSVPRDPSAAKAAEILRQDLAETRSLDRLARETGASKRTLERRFRSETGMGPGRWRQQLRLMHALRLLAEGQSVTTVALEVGYQSTSAFISMFKRAMGATPFRYRVRLNETASNTQAAMKDKPPNGVTAPSVRIPVIAST